MSPPAVSLMSMREARDLYFKANGFSVEGYSASTFTLKLLGIPFTFPSTANRKKALPLHDFHHILTGYGTNWIGEAEIGAWELRAGCNSLVAYSLNGSAAVLGLFISRAGFGEHSARPAASTRSTVKRNRMPHCWR